MPAMSCNICFCQYYPTLMPFTVRHPFKPKLRHLNTPSLQGHSKERTRLSLQETPAVQG